MIVIHAAGNERIGIGHLMRCKHLGDYMVQQLDVPVYLVCETDLAHPERFAIAGANCRIAGAREEGLAAIRSIMSVAQPPRILLADLLGLTYEDHLFYREMGFDYLIQLNDNQTDQFQPDAVINGDAFDRCWNTDPAKTRILSGPQYQIFSMAMQNKRPSEPWNRSVVQTVLVAFGGADPAHYTELLLKDIKNNRALQNIHFQVVIGPAFSKERTKETVSMAYENVSFLLQPDMTDAIMQADVVLTLGGITAYEGMLLGKPVAAFAWRHMAFYAEQLGQMGILASLGEGQEAVAKLGDFLANTENLRRMARRGWTLIDGKGVERITAYIRSNFLEGGVER